MSGTFYDLHGVRICALGAEGKKVGSDREAIEWIGRALAGDAGLVLVPVERLTEDFFRLRTGVAGAVVQKFVTYRLRMAIVGDVWQYVEESGAFRDFVVEASRGDQVWFVSDVGELEGRLKNLSVAGSIFKACE